VGAVLYAASHVGAAGPYIAQYSDGEHDRCSIAQVKSKPRAAAYFIEYTGKFILAPDECVWLLRRASCNVAGALRCIVPFLSGSSA
jgi:hypothetical protein